MDFSSAMKFLLATVVIFCNTLNFNEAKSAWVISNSTIPNNAIFEKFELQIINKSLFIGSKLNWKMVAPNVFNFRSNVNVTKSFNEVWVNIVVYHKYLTYQKYLIDVWIDVCQALKDPAKNPLAELLWDIYLQYRDNLKLNFNPTCPFYGNLVAESLRPINYSYVNLPLMKAGRYRADFRFTNFLNGPIAIIFQLYGAISDFRVYG